MNLAMEAQSFFPIDLSPLFTPWVGAACILSAAILFEVIFRVAVRWRASEMRETGDGRPEPWWRGMVRAARGPVSLLLWTFALTWSGLQLAVAWPAADFEDLQRLAPTVQKLGFMLAVFWFLFRATRVLECGLVKYAATTERRWDAVVGPLTGKALRTVLPLLALFFVLPLFHIPMEYQVHVHHLLSILIIVAVSAVLIHAINALENAVLEQFPMDVRDNLHARKVYTQVYVLKRVLLVVVALVAFASTLMVFDAVRQFGASILASAGIAGIILGFAAQRSLATLFAGFQIAFTQPIRLDDVVIVENEWGKVEEITLTYVVVRIWDQRRLVLPIQYFIEQPFQNWTRHSADILGTVFLYLDYHVPVDEIRAELDRIVKDNPKWDGVVKGVQVTDLTDRSMEVRILAGSPDSSAAWDLRCEIREKMVAYIGENHPEALPRLRAEFNPDGAARATGSGPTTPTP